MVTVPLTPKPALPAGRTPAAPSTPGARTAPAGEWLFGPYHLVTAPARLHAGERSRELDPRALAVLECLLHHAGEVVPRAVLIAEAWPDVDTVLDSTVSKVMRRLRIALGDAGGHVLQTVYGEGYRLALPATWLPSMAPAPGAPPAAPVEPGADASATDTGAATGIGPVVEPVSVASPAPHGADTLPSAARPGQPMQPPGRRRTWLAWLPWIVATLALLLAGYLGWLLMRGTGSAP